MVKIFRTLNAGKRTCLLTVTYLHVSAACFGLDVLSYCQTSVIESRVSSNIIKMGIDSWETPLQHLNFLNDNVKLWMDDQGTRILFPTEKKYSFFLYLIHSNYKTHLYVQ
jgi:hypothetical protein